MFESDFTQPLRATLGRDRPKNQRQIFRAELRGVGEMIEVQRNTRGTGVGCNSSLAARFRHQCRAAKIDFCRSLPVVIVDGGNGSGRDVNSENGYRPVGARRNTCLHGIGDLGRESGTE